jgi:hypothetical protein
MTCLQLAITEPISPVKALYQQPARAPKNLSR